MPDAAPDVLRENPGGLVARRDALEDPALAGEALSAHGRRETVALVLQSSFPRCRDDARRRPEDASQHTGRACLRDAPISCGIHDSKA